MEQYRDALSFEMTIPEGRNCSSREDSTVNPQMSNLDLFAEATRVGSEAWGLSLIFFDLARKIGFRFYQSCTRVTNSTKVKKGSWQIIFRRSSAPVRQKDVPPAIGLTLPACAQPCAACVKL